MARPLRVVFEGALYHVINRGNEKNNIFRDERDYRVFLKLLRETVIEHKWICYGYCLMGNHYHILIETPRANISKGMKKINAQFTQYFNFRYKRTGHLFQGRFKSNLVEKNSYLLELFRYIVMNPIRAGLCKKPNEYQWSSYGAMTSKDSRHDFVEKKWILSQFGDDFKTAAINYKNFIKDEISFNIKWSWEKLIPGIYLGSEVFLYTPLHHPARQEKID